jgi:hypothetical protein
MQIEITKTEAWRILDSLDAYKKDYEVTASVNKTINTVEKKLKKIVNST